MSGNRIRRASGLGILIPLALAGVVAAQSRGGFRVPAAGEMLPDVTVFDDQGREFSTKSLREHYSVLVFGCLT